ncbi:MAG TPA: AarF/UbiB family protein [Acidimicrobiales bacterium]
MKVIVGTDRSPSAAIATSWAADLARRFDAELVLVQILPNEAVAADLDHETARPGVASERQEDRGRRQVDEHGVSCAATSVLSSCAASLDEEAHRLLGPHARGQVIVGDDPAAELVRAAERENADVVVVGNVGMAGRTQFLLANVPNRVSHLARCTVIIVNSANGRTDKHDVGRHRHVHHRGRGPEPGDVPASESGDRRGGRSRPREPLMSRRAAHISRVLVHAVLAEARARQHPQRAGPSEAQRAERLRQELEALGPTFSKLGQVLSTRPDLLPPAYIDALEKLQDHVVPLDEATVVSVMERELGVPWEDVFETIDPTPLAAGTIAQVHRATLTGGERVVVKVQRPDAEAAIKLDLALLDAFARRIAAHPRIRSLLDVQSIVAHLSATIIMELDFRHEAANLERLRAIVAGYSRLGVPELHPELCTTRLLVMQEIPGVPIGRARPDPGWQEAARQLMESYYRQVLTEGFFHADPHPGNLLWWDGKLWFIDLGMVGELDSRTRADLLMLFLAFWRDDAQFLAEMALALAGDEPPSDLDLDNFRADLAELLTRTRGQPLDQLPLASILQEMTVIALRHGVALPTDLVLTAKALAQVQLAAATLDPTLDPLAVAGTFIARSSLEAARDAMDPKDLLYEARKLKARFVRALEAFEALTGARPGPRLEVQVPGTDRIEAGLRRAGSWLALALALAGSLVATAVVATSPNASSGTVAIFGVLTVALVTWLALTLRRPTPTGRR